VSFTTDLSDYYTKMHVALEENLSSMNDMRNIHKILGELAYVNLSEEAYTSLSHSIYLAPSWSKAIRNT